MIAQRPLWLDLAAISRAYSIPYTALVGFAAMFTAPAPLSTASAALGLAIPAAFAVGIAALNDYAHASADQRAGRGRSYHPRLLLALGLAGASLALALAASAGWGVLAGLVGSAVAGLLYAALKRHPGAGNLLRGATTVPLVLGLGAIAGAGQAALPVALAAGLLDAAGNIWGDLRDLDHDRRSGTRTLALVAPTAARACAVGLHLAAVAMLATISVWTIISLAGAVWTLRQPLYWRHRSFLITKYATVGWVAWSLHSTPLEAAITLLLALSAMWAHSIYTHIHSPVTKEIPGVVPTAHKPA